MAAPWVTPQNPYDLGSLDILDSRQPPGAVATAGFTMLLGSDGLGRDLYSAIVYGLRISLFVGVASGVIALLIGMCAGLLAAYAGGRTEAVIMRVVDLQLSFPAILVALMLVAVVGKGVDKIMLALVAVQWAYYARTIRASALVERRKEYVEAARGLALGPVRIMLRHILPNCMAPLIVVGTVQTAHAIALEATLSFLGVGMPQTEPSLGVLIANGFEYMLSGRYWISTLPRHCAAGHDREHQPRRRPAARHPEPETAAMTRASCDGTGLRRDLSPVRRARPHQRPSRSRTCARTSSPSAAPSRRWTG